VERRHGGEGGAVAEVARRSVVVALRWGEFFRTVGSEWIRHIRDGRWAGVGL
jgi:hypothetical protein